MDENALGLYIAKHREAAGITQKALSEAVGVSRPYMTQIENGSRVPSDDVFQRIFRALGIPIQQVMDDLLQDQIDPEEYQVLSQSVHAYDTLSALLTPDQLAQVVAAMGSPEQMAATMNLVIPGSALPGGPDGWSALSKEDRRLVQRIVNRLLDARE